MYANPFDTCVCISVHCTNLGRFLFANKLTIAYLVQEMYVHRLPQPEHFQSSQ